MKLDFNLLERKARQFLENHRPKDALAIYLFMSDGDQSLDGGYLGERIGRCYEQMGDPHSASYWYGRAVEENPEVRTQAADARKRLNVSIQSLLED